MGLNDSEYALILELLKREPTYTELGMFAVMWSEHCGYKYSRPILAYFKKYKEALEGDGLENAGVIDIGNGMGITMKVESHNHPSSVEPYQGAATGVGGIIRDILTMGARPIAGLNSLRFGPIEPGHASEAVTKRNKYLFDHVVAGIAGYGNCVGVPTVAGEVNFHPRYSGNPLVNAMCVGILKLDEVTTASASGVGNPVLYLGSSTGRDGIHGATFASEALDEESDAKRPNVQIGDPFAEKQLIEATLEALQTGAIVAIQDMGAAGLTCSTVEMASKGGVGMSVDLDKVPMRESDMSGYELMLSESQERMLAVAHAGRESEVIEVFHKWGVHAEVIGHVVEGGILTVTRSGETIAELDPKLLTDFCPTYTTPIVIPNSFEEAGKFDPNALPEVDPHESLMKLLASPDIASKRYVFQQYDSQVQTQTVSGPGAADAAVLAPEGCTKGISLKIDGNGRYCLLHPRRGGELAVAEACRNVACTGAQPVALTDGLNFGNPQHSHVYWQFSEAVQGIAHAAEVLGTPVVSGNVSFYNESELGEVPPTPLIGALGILEDASDAIGLAPKLGDRIVLLSVPIQPDAHQGLGGSSFLQTIFGQETGYPAQPNLEGEAKLNTLLFELAKAKLIHSAHDVSDGGPAVALAEMCIVSGLGMSVSLPAKSQQVALFNELPGQVFVGTTSVEEVENRATKVGIDFVVVGGANQSGELNVKTSRDANPLVWNVAELAKVFEEAIPNLMS